MVTILPSMGRLPRDVGLNFTASLSLLPISLWFLLYIYSLGTFFSSLQVIFTDSCSVNSCNFGVPEGGGDFKIFLPLHLDQDFCPLKIYLFKTF